MIVFFMVLYGWVKESEKLYVSLLDVVRIGHGSLERGRIKVVVLHDTFESIVVCFLDIFRHIHTELLSAGNGCLNLAPIGSELFRFLLGVNVFGVGKVANRLFHGLANGALFRVRSGEAAEVIT